MTSTIDPSKPPHGSAQTADVRQNFAAAKSEIEALQAQVATLQTAPRIFATGDWQWLTGAVTGSIANNKVGCDTDDWAVATQIVFSKTDTNSSDFTGQINVMSAGDEILIYERRNSVNSLRVRLTAPPVDNTSYFTFPVSIRSVKGIEPGNNADITVNLILNSIVLP